MEELRIRRAHCSRCVSRFLPRTWGGFVETFLAEDSTNPAFSWPLLSQLVPRRGLVQLALPPSQPDDSEKKTDNPVGSLILHAVTDHGNCCGDAHVGSLVLHEDNGSLACDVETCVRSRQNVPWFQPLKGPDDC